VFRKSVEKTHVSLKSDKNKGTLHDFSHLWQYIAKFLEWERFYTKFVEKIKIRILCSVTFFLKSCRLWDSYVMEPERESMAHTCCMLDKQGRMRARSGTHPHTHARTHPRARWHAGQYVILIACSMQQCVVNALECYVTRTLPVLLNIVIRLCVLVLP
jgi:hypothetical protein